MVRPLGRDRRDGIVGLYRKGHEIACHTFSHASTLDLDASAMAAEIEKKPRLPLSLNPSIRIENFAYPYGVGSVARKGQLNEIFHSSRGVLPGVNSGTVDLQYLRSTPLINKDIDESGIDRAFDETVKKKWLADFL